VAWWEVDAVPVAVVLVVSMGCRWGADVDDDGALLLPTLVLRLVLLVLLLLVLLSNSPTPVNWEKSKSGRLRSPVLVSTGKYLSNSFCVQVGLVSKKFVR
jgi:NADH:ubiquinone oxidoreductase subunit 6 (subunit J)